MNQGITLLALESIFLLGGLLLGAYLGSLIYSLFCALLEPKNERTMDD